MGGNLRRIRKANGLSIAALATYIDITPGFLGLIERGQRSLTAMMMYRAAEFFEVPVSTFFRCREYDENLRIDP